MNQYLEVTIRCLIAFAFLFIITEILGSKHISQLTFFDYVVGITIGSIAATMSIDDALPIWYGVIGLAVFGGLSFIISIINRKTVLGRRIFTGNPIFLISEGVILYNEIKRARLNINDLLRELRTQGYFNIADIHHAILETNGSISVLPKSLKKPVFCEDLNLNLPQQGIYANVIIDKKIMKGNLDAMHKDEDWLFMELKKQKEELKNIALATLDLNGNLSVYPINKEKKHRTIFQ